MSLPKLRPILGDRRDVRASLQVAEQNLLKQKSFMEADLRKRQNELQRNERMLKKTFGNLPRTSTSSLGAVQTNLKDVRGGHGASDGSDKGVKFNRDQDAITTGVNRRLGRRHSLHSDTLTFELSRVGIGPSAPNRVAGRKHGRRGSVDANIPASRLTSTPSVGDEAINKIEESDSTKQADGDQIIDDTNSEIFSKNTNGNLIHGSSRERNAVFSFKYGEDDSKVQKVQSCFAVDKPQEAIGERDRVQSDKPKSALSRSRSQRKKLRVKIMSPVQELTQSPVPAADVDGQLDSGISEESENSSCGTRSLYSDSYDSLSHASESDSSWCPEEVSNTSRQGKLSINVNSNHLLNLKPLKKNRVPAVLEKIQSPDRVDNDSLAVALRAADDNAFESAQISDETRGPSKASLARRRRSIAAAEGISLYRQDKTNYPPKRYSDTVLLMGHTELSPLIPRSGRRGSVGDSLGARDNGDVGPTPLTSGRQEGIRQSVPPSPAKVKAQHKPAGESNRHVQKTIERAAAWEAVRRTRYLPGYEPNTH